MKVLNVQPIFSWWQNWYFLDYIIMIIILGLGVMIVLLIINWIIKFRYFLEKGLGEELTKALREEGYEEETWGDMEIEFLVVNKDYEA